MPVTISIVWQLYRKNPEQNILKPLTLQVQSHKPKRLERNEIK